VLLMLLRHSQTIYFEKLSGSSAFQTKNAETQREYLRLFLHASVGVTVDFLLSGFCGRVSGVRLFWLGQPILALLSDSYHYGLFLLY